MVLRLHTMGQAEAVAAAAALHDATLLVPCLDLISWARGGQGTPARAVQVLTCLVGRLLPLVPGADPLEARIGHPPAPLDALAVAIMGARGRLRLERDGLIEPRELAALLDVDESWVRSLARSQKLERASGKARAALTRASCEPFLARARVNPWGQPGDCDGIPLPNGTPDPMLTGP